MLVCVCVYESLINESFCVIVHMTVVNICIPDFIGYILLNMIDVVWCGLCDSQHHVLATD